MNRLTSIVALNEDGAIGVGNALPWRIRTDLRFFRRTTTDHIVIMGRRTFDSLGKPLPHRQNVVVTHRFALFPEAENCRSSGGIVEAMALAERLSVRPRKEVFIVGGASMYEQFSPYVDRYLITEVQKPIPNADTFFDRSILGDYRQWNWRTLLEAKANFDEGDEADFRIFEAVAKDPSLFQEARSAAFAEFDTLGGLSSGFRRRPRRQIAATA